jgi:hypothetical protein
MANNRHTQRRMDTGTMTPEGKIKNDIKKILREIPNLRLFVNPSGRLRTDDGRYVSFGLGGHPGSSDYIGWESIAITSEMVGQKFARFVAVECKAPGKEKQTTKEQDLWLDLVVDGGGTATIISDAQQLKVRFNHAT